MSMKKGVQLADVHAGSLSFPSMVSAVDAVVQVYCFGVAVQLVNRRMRLRRKIKEGIEVSSMCGGGLFERTMQRKITS